MNNFLFYILTSFVADLTMLMYIPFFCSLLCDIEKKSISKSFILAVSVWIIMIMAEWIIRYLGIALFIKDIVSFIVIVLAYKFYLSLSYRKLILSFGLYLLVIVSVTQALAVSTVCLVYKMSVPSFISISSFISIESKKAYLLSILIFITCLTFIMWILKHNKIIKRLPEKANLILSTRMLFYVVVTLFAISYNFMYFRYITQNIKDIGLFTANTALLSFMLFDLFVTSKNLFMYKTFMEERKVAIERLRSSQEKLIQLERMATLGQMIGGVAHNLLNPIASISGTVDEISDLVKEYNSSIGDNEVTKEDHHEIARDMKKWLGQIKPQMLYMSDMITAVKGQVTNFSYGESTIFSVNDLLKTVRVLMGYQLKASGCNLNIKTGRGVLEAKICGNINSMVQIINNVLINAIQSYDLNKQSLLGVDFTINIDKDSIIFKIRDYGRGIPTHIQTRLFKEMATTKGKSGSGLGLFISYSSVKGQFGGDMWFESVEGRGSIFYISVPCYAEEHI